MSYSPLISGAKTKERIPIHHSLGKNRWRLIHRVLTGLRSKSILIRELASAISPIGPVSYQGQSANVEQDQGNHTCNKFFSINKFNPNSSPVKRSKQKFKDKGDRQGFWKKTFSLGNNKDFRDDTTAYHQSLKVKKVLVKQKDVYFWIFSLDRKYSRNMLRLKNTACWMSWLRPWLSGWLASITVSPIS